MRERIATVKSFLCSSGKMISTERKNLFHRVVMRSAKCLTQQEFWPLCFGATSAQVAPFLGVDVFLKSANLAFVDG